MATQDGAGPHLSDHNAQDEHRHSCLYRAAREAQGVTHIIQNSVPVWYDHRVRVVPCSSDRVPKLPVEVLYRVAEALPRPKWVYNLARVNRESWQYLQPALFKCEVTYEAKLKENFGIGDEEEDASGNWSTRWYTEAQTDKEESRRRCERCVNFNVTLVGECEEQIAIERAVFKSGNWNALLQEQAMNADMTALHWACANGADGVSVGLKAIRAASVHGQPSYISGTGLQLRHRRISGNRDKEPFAALIGEIPPPLFLSIVFGNAELFEALIKAGCNLNLLRSGEPSLYPFFPPFFVFPYKSPVIVGKIHESCGPFHAGFGRPACKWYDSHLGTCQTAGFMALYHRRPDMLGSLLDGGLDPLLGRDSLIHEAVSVTRDVSAVKALLDRHPELANLRWGADSRTPLHVLCAEGKYGPWLQGDSPQLSTLLAIGRCLIQSGADMEAVAQENGRPGQPRLEGTPLQWSLQVIDRHFYKQEGINTAEAFITMGSVWNQPFQPSSPRESILDHCISRATILEQWPNSELSYDRPSDELWAERRLRFTLILKAMVKTTIDYVLERGETQSTAHFREIFLEAFNRLATQSMSLPTQYDAFATEIVGKLILATGITPDASLISNWTQSMRKIQGRTAQTPSGRNRSLWKDILSDRLISNQELKIE